MALDALAPDQRAVVQLVLQQERSYQELAGMLGISTEAVRERAHRGLERLAGTGGLGPDDLGDVADYLLGQQPVSRRALTRRLLSESPLARAWARRVSDELAPIARGELPEVPEDTATVVDERPEPEAAPAERPEPAEEPAEAPPVRARPRPRPPAADRPRRERPSQRPARETTGFEAPEERRESPRSSRLGGALLIGGIAVVLVTLVVWLVVKGGDDGEGERAATSPTPTATATPEFQPIGQLPLRAAGGGDAKGQMTIFATQEGALAFTIQGEDLPQSADGEAYAVWLTGGDRPHRLGFAPPVGKDGKFGTSGPRESDADKFGDWLAEAEFVVVSRETTEDATQPGPVVLRAKIPSSAGSGGSGSGG